MSDGKSDHDSAAAGSRALCDALMEALSAREPTVVRKTDRVGSCPFATAAGGNFAYVVHAMAEDSIGVQCVGDPDRLEAAVRQAGLPWSPRGTPQPSLGAGAVKLTDGDAALRLAGVLIGEMRDRSGNEDASRRSEGLPSATSVPEATPRVWRIYVREGSRGPDFAPNARRGGYVALGGVAPGSARDFSSEADFVRAYTAAYSDGAVRAAQIWQLLQESRARDWVVMPSRKERRVHVGRMKEGGYYFADDDPEVRFAHRWPVEWLGDTSYEHARQVCGLAILGQRALLPLDVPPDAIASLVDVTNRTDLYDAWAERARQTARLVRAVYDHAASTGRLSGHTPTALCRLAWFTRGKGDVQDPFGGTVAKDYWRTTKLPGLIEAFGLPADTRSLEAAATAIAANAPDAVDARLVTEPTGFVFAYPAYRNAAARWFDEHAARVLSLLAQARVLESDAAGSRLADQIARLPTIPRPDGGARIAAANILTPVVACLDPRWRFPLLNGADHVHSLLQRLGVAGAALADQHDHLVAIIDPAVPSRRDSFALDQHGLAGADAQPRRTARSQPLVPKPIEGRDLPVKDARDIEAIVRGGRRLVRRLHNDMTNALERLCRGRLAAQEGVAPDCMYDALVAAYDGRGRDLLIEVKSSIDRGVLRLAVGQLLDYRRGLQRRDVTDLAVLLPEEPDPDAVAFLHHAGVRVCWFTDAALRRIGGDWEFG